MIRRRPQPGPWGTPLSFTLWLAALLCLLGLLSGPAAAAQLNLPPARVPQSYAGEALDLEVARRWAPVFYQRLAGRDYSPRFDYITNFDFDGDWDGANNWENAADSRFPMRAYVYYSVIESETHYFITYAVYHARDWSPLEPLLGSVLDNIQNSEQYGKYLPPALRQQLELNHENDMEGVQIVVRKAGPREPEGVEAAETMAHFEFHRYFPRGTPLVARVPERQLLQLTPDGRPLLYVEALKHGVHAYPYRPKHSLASPFDMPDGPLLVYRFTGAADDPQRDAGGERSAGGPDSEAGYDLLPLYSHFWTKARGLVEPNRTFGEIHDFGDLFCQQLAAPVLKRVSEEMCRLGATAIALRGDYAGKNKAYLPWGWNNLGEPFSHPTGEWFFNPARVMRAHFPAARLSNVYLSNPFLGIFRAGPAALRARP